ncbi:TRPM7 [Mytilus coruscus]|uniref:TRPM7 n=1 Tax=Mytilus coruscus TaxID=42192 RepID=A0A6J8F5W3_MYTCO|nr:TRPM7 [Mytilus coruscus]
MLVICVVGSWILTCGTESGVVNFIEEAVNEHSTLEKYNIPIVGLLSERVINEVKTLGRPLDVAKIIDGEVKRVKTPVKSVKETLDPTHTQFIVLKDSNCKNAHYETNEILPVVLVLFEGGIDAMETALSVLENDNPVVVMDGSGGAADFLSICHQRHNRKSDSKQANLSDYVENLHELIRKCFEDKSDEIKIKANKLATRCLKKPELIRVYSLEEKTTKLDHLIQNAIFDIYKECFNTEDDRQKECASGNVLKLNAVKKQLELVTKWKNYDIAKKEIFIAENRNQLTCLQFQVENKARCYSVLSKSFTELIEHLHDLSFDDRKELIEEFEEIIQDFIDFFWVKKAGYFSVLSRSFDKLVNHLPADDHDELTREFQSISETFVKMHTFDEKSMDKLDKKIKRKIMAKRKYFEELEYYHDYDQYKDKLLQNYIAIKAVVVVVKARTHFFLQFVEINRADYFMDKNRPNYFKIINKAKYFTNMTKSFANLIKSMTDESFVKHEDDLRRILKEFVDEFEKDSVSELFQSSLLANKTELVMLVMQNIENMSSFVLNNLPNVYRLSIEIKDCSAIQLIQQHWDKHHEKDVESDLTGKLDSELKKAIDKVKKKKEKKNNRVLLAVNNFIIDLFENTKFKLYEVKGEEKKELELVHKDKPFHHLFIWAVLVNWREMAMIFWEQENDHTCSALFASAVLKELSEKAHFSKHMHLSKSLKENSR